MKKWMAIVLMVMALVVGAQEKQDVQDIEDISLEDLLNTEISSASKFSQKLSEAPSIVSVVTADQIAQYGWNSINDILYRMPGFSPSKDYDRSTVGSRGLFEGWNNNHLLLLIDGVPYNDNLYGTAYTSEITPLFMVKSTEIIRGPGSALYGSNATNGVVSINTYSAEDLKGKGYASFRAGEYNTQIYDLLAGNSFENFSVVTGFNYSRTDGNEYSSYDGSGRFDQAGRPEMFMVKDARSSQYFFGKITGEKALKGLTLQIHHQAWDFQTGHGWLWMIPDFDESMKESRLMFSLSYKPQSTGKWSQEYLVRYQRHNIDWNMMFYPKGAFDGYYPAGTLEYLNTGSQDIFARVQLAYDLGSQASVLLGVEGDLFLYNGDKEHTANTDFNDEGGFSLSDGTEIGYHEGWWAPFPNNEMRKMGPWLEWVMDKPVKNLGIYAQFASGELVAKRLQVTAGLRFDTQWFDYNAIDLTGSPVESKSFSQFSPRLGLVYILNDNLTIKALAGKAFRAPSPTELFGANTWTLASNLRELDPEIITTFEGAMDWRITKGVSWRLNVYHTRFENQIAYSVANNNLSTNVYTLSNMGVETELFMGAGDFRGFVNLSLNKRLDEEIFDENIIPNTEDVTWIPAATVNVGMTYQRNDFSASAQLHYQGKVMRRESDNVTADYLPYRPEELAAWTSFDLRLAYRITPCMELSVSGTNLFDSDLFLMKNFSFPFDYRMMGRRLMGQVKITF